MQSEFNSRRGMRGMNRDGSSRGSGMPFGPNRFMGRGPPMPPMKPSGMRSRETMGPRMGASMMRDFGGGSFGGLDDGRYFEDARDQWEPPPPPPRLSMRNAGPQMEEGNFFPMSNFGPGPDHGRFRQNNLPPNFNPSDGFPSPQGGSRRRRSRRRVKLTELEKRRAKRMFQIPPGRFAPPGPFPPRGFGPPMRPPFLGFGWNRRNTMDKNKKPQKQNERSVKKPSPPWFDEEVFKLLKDKGKAHKRMKRSNTEANVQAFKDLRKEVRRLTRQKYNDYCIKEGIPNKYTEAAKAKKQKAEEAAAAKAALENNNEASAEAKEENTEVAAEVVDNENTTVENTTEVVEENNVDSAQLANNSSPVVENSSPVVENNNSPPVENPGDSSSLMEDSTQETTES